MGARSVATGLLVLVLSAGLAAGKDDEDAEKEFLKALKGKPAMVFTCGPWAMMDAVAQICMQAGVPSYASLESIMACGYGVCNGCVAKVLEDNEHGFRYAKTCVEGTVMDCSKLVW